jgi:hypothetical protein
MYIIIVYVYNVYVCILWMYMVNIDSVGIISIVRIVMIVSTSFYEVI